MHADQSPFVSSAVETTCDASGLSTSLETSGFFETGGY
jgi:hypothetical protein